MTTPTKDPTECVWHTCHEPRVAEPNTPPLCPHHLDLANFARFVVERLLQLVAVPARPQGGGLVVPGLVPPSDVGTRRQA